MNVQQTKTSSLKDFQVIQELGKGSFSTVYKVKRIADGQEYALKKVKLGSLKYKEKENALNEVRLLASINSKYIVAYKEAFFDDECKCLCTVMELLSGGDVYRRITQAQKGGPQFSEQDIWIALIHMILGLKTLHDQKIVHRDLKSANVFLSSDGTFKLGDLNVSKVAKQGFVYTQTGTPYYASPEVWRDEPYDLKSDIWSLGCVLYEMCCLQTPFRAKEMDVLFQKVQKGLYDQIPAKYSKDLAQIISLLLKTQSSQRPNCEELLKNPIIQNRMRDIETHINPQPQNQELLKTIQIPRTTDQLNSQFPKSKYENEIMSIERNIENKSTENSSSPFRSPQQIIKTQQDSRLSQVKDRQITDITKSIAYLERKNKHPLLIEGPRPSASRKLEKPKSAQPQQRYNNYDKESQLGDSYVRNSQINKIKEFENLRIKRENELKAIQELRKQEIQDSKIRELRNLKQIRDASKELIAENRRISPISQAKQNGQYGEYQHQYGIQKHSYSPITRKVELPQYNNKVVQSQIQCRPQISQSINISNPSQQIRQPILYQEAITSKRQQVPQSAAPVSQIYSSNQQQLPKSDRYQHPQSALPARVQSQKLERSQVFPVQARVVKTKPNDSNAINKNQSTTKQTRPLSSNLISNERLSKQEYQPQSNQIHVNYNHYYPIETYQRHASDQNLIKYQQRQQNRQLKQNLESRKI
ncbi:unnamed protein product (macronuclear) [Paramecium tetraurelia]|uniref:non-specific serine/threonine protein kinase n=1 Tax=Paramecium tetraurelia TaxID=5888 RepID=A0DVH6_PARTE|nr:uncharacterized protein GSPATT00020696001 [Paramecium tetraurelia]CAK87043.1 unnamed protein product [Paramecium tetraurelia]|eukprot:XP_001454440.1 hypothetical protein (macronuclear) [Paramecium tetraurelia strain d4-2]